MPERHPNPAWARYLAFWRRDPRAELEDELAFHLAARIDEYVAAGMEPGAAHAHAAMRLGNLARVRTDCRRIDDQYARRRSMSDVVHGLAADLRFAVRQLARQRALAAAAIICLALGIGANTAIFSVVDAVLFRPLPFRDPGRLVLIGEGLPMISEKNFGQISTPDFRDFAALDGTLLQSSAAFEPTALTVAGHGPPERVSGLQVSASLFTVLGVQPALGRVFRQGDDAIGAADAVVLSDAFWHRRFGADPSIIGHPIDLDGRPTVVVGVMPPGFTFPLPGLGVDPAALFVPLRLTPAVLQARGNTYNAYMIARLAPGASVERATAGVNTIAQRMPATYPDVYSSTFRIVAEAFPLRDQLVSAVRRPLIVLLGAVGFVLLIACINVAGLLVARAASRTREIALRRALGASRTRLVEQYLIEGGVLVALGVAGALALAHWCTLALAHVAPDDLLSGYRIGIDPRVLAFTLGVAALAAVLFSLVPVLHRSGNALPDNLRDDGRGASAGRARQRGRRVLVASELALALVLATGAGLLARSFANALQVDPGFSPAHLLSFRTAFPAYRYPSAPRAFAAERQLVGALAHMPDARGATAAVNLPMAGAWQITFTPDGTTLSKVPLASAFIVLPDYFRTLGIRLVAGRAFDAHDDATSPSVSIIDEGLARHFFPQGDPIGRRLKWGPPQSTDPWTTIVGVVRTVKTHSLDEESLPEIYFPAQQLAKDSSFVDAALRGLTYVVRTRGDPLSMSDEVTRTVRAADPELAITHMESADQLVSQSVATRRFDLLLIAAFAALALLLAAVGLYGLVSHSVAQRQREIGVRIAVGATMSGIVGLVLREGLVTAAWGAMAGLAGAVALTRVMQSLLFGVSTLDATTLVASTALLIAVAALASWLPARRAARIDPTVAMRDA